MRKIGRRRFLRLLGAGAAACAGGAVYAHWIEPFWLRIEAAEVPIPGLHPAFDGYRVVQLSDLHVGAGVPRSYLEWAVREANRQNPDVTVITGDVIHEQDVPGAAAQAGRLLSGLRARDGVFAVLGNHDTGVNLGLGPQCRTFTEGLCAHLGSVGVRVLENEVAHLEREGGRLRLVGLGDLWTGRFEPATAARGDIQAPSLVLSHNPDTAPDLARRGAGLILSGHTHGGQVRLPLVGAPVLPLRDTNYVSGLYELGPTRLYVNRGVGWLRQVRFGAPPEVTVLTLRPA